MPIIDMKDMLNHAWRNGYAVGAFEVSNLDVLRAVMGAAEKHRAPVVLDIPGGEERELLMAAAETAARRANIPVALHCRWGNDLAAVFDAVNHGCNGVSIEGPGLLLGDHIERTRETSSMARACGLVCGGVLSGEGPTTAGEAKGFSDRTGVDFLEISFAYRQPGGRLKLDWNRLREIGEAVAMPLAIELERELSGEQFRKLSALCVAKVTCKIPLEVLAQKLLRNSKVTLQSLFHELAQAVALEAEQYMLLLGAAGRAAEILAQSRLWLNVVHLVAFNAPLCSQDELRLAMKEGQRMLVNIPGVRAVVAGSVTEMSARYRHCWLVVLTSPMALENFRKHHDQVAFEEKILRPATADRIVGDYTLADQVVGVEQLPLSLAHTVDTAYGHPGRTGTVTWKVRSD